MFMKLNTFCCIDKNKRIILHKENVEYYYYYCYSLVRLEFRLNNFAILWFQYKMRNYLIQRYFFQFQAYCCFFYIHLHK